MRIDPETGEYVDDEADAGGTGGSIAEQDNAPSFAPPPVPMTNPLTQPLTAPTIAPTISGQPTGNYEAPPLNTNPGVVTKRTQLSDASKGALDALAGNGAATDATTSAQRDNAEAAGRLAEDKAVNAMADAQAEADLKAQHIAEQERQRQQHEERVRTLQQRDEQEYEKFKGMGLKDPDADKSFAHRLGAALAIGLGQYSAAINHTSNAAAKIFEDARADNYAQQKAAIEHQKEVSIRAGHNVDEAERRAAEAEHRLQTKQVAQIDAFRAKFKAESLRLGIPEARINATKTMLDLDKAANKEREQHLETFVKVLEPTNTVSRDMTPLEMRKRGGGGGGGAGLDRFVRAANQLGPGDQITPEVALLGRAAGLKPNQIAAEVDRYRGSGAKSNKAGGAAAIGDVHGPGGAVIGNISTGDPALDRKRSEEVAKANTIYTDLAATLKALEESRKKEGVRVPSVAGFSLSDVAAKREALHSHALIQLKEMAKLGVLAGPDMAIMESQLGGGLANSSGVGGSKMGEIRKIVDAGHARFLDSVGLDGKAALPKLRGDSAAAAGPEAVDKRALAQEAIDDPNAPAEVKARALKILRGK
jgi:hypothetical protein